MFINRKFLFFEYARHSIQAQWRIQGGCRDASPHRMELCQMFNKFW